MMSLFILNRLHDVGRAGPPAGSQRYIQLPAQVTMDSERLGVGSQFPRKTSQLGTLADHRPSHMGTQQFFFITVDHGYNVRNVFGFAYCCFDSLITIL